MAYTMQLYNISTGQHSRQRNKHKDNETQQQRNKKEKK